ncbi:MAG TPA: hypothetical protein VLQ80_18300 [Candidatus Saccharimonadia bacterium]|nr:hypothetical protein [Candidatus Saccharimonadia bacterium]
MQRHFLGFLVHPALLRVPLPPLAQPPTQVPRRGGLWLGASAGHPSLLDAFGQGLRELGMAVMTCSALDQRA